MKRCGKCAGCRRMIEGDMSAKCVLNQHDRPVIRHDPEADHARRIEGLRAVIKRHGRRLPT